jgi:hypothetical protein
MKNLFLTLVVAGALGVSAYAQEIRRDRIQNGGNLTNNEKAHVNRQQNRLSRNIYRDKHNAALQ